MKGDVARAKKMVVAGEWGDDIWIDEPMSSHTSYRVGGPADIFAVATDAERLRELLQRAGEERIPAMVLGGGTNILVADRGFRGLVIQNACRGIDRPNAELMRVRAGELLRTVARQTVGLGLGGLEWAVDIPGTVGGAVVGNAGAFGGYIGDVLQRALLLDPEGEVRWEGPEELELEYRSSRLKRMVAQGQACETVLEVEIALGSQPVDSLQQMAAEYSRRRKERQPLEPSAGSVFKRTAQYPAGFLIEQVGLKGERVGDAQISLKHANFIVNLGKARSTDIKELIDRCQHAVERVFHLELELEIELVGDW